MPASFPRLDLPSGTHLTHSLSTILSHAQTLLKAQLEQDGLSGQQEEEVCRKLLQNWLDQGEKRLVEGNITFDGVKPRQDWKHKGLAGGKGAVAPFDEQLNRRIDNLQQTADDLTETAVEYRRELPERWAQALRDREEILDEIRGREEQRKAIIRKKGWGERDVSMVQLPIEREEEVAKTLRIALSQAEMLAEDLPAQIQATQDQRELVEQLRQMPP